MPPEAWTQSEHFEQTGQTLLSEYLETELDLEAGLEVGSLR